mmetsp:Transcript_52800/g.92692  ORF Transcript_52800/g.92692 Transcript_52800/m.92692 type:complete len:432 (-) Transcript_52800:7-1302(-)
MLAACCSSSHVGSDGEFHPAMLLPHVRLVDYGVLGSKMTAAKTFEQVAPEPDEDTAVVDPAGLKYIQDIGPSGATGAAGAIYDWLGIKSDASFPERVKKEVTAEGEALYQRYGSKGNYKKVIHVVGPQLFDIEGTGPEIVETAIDRLAKAYFNTLYQYLFTRAKTLRLLPISGGLFAGRFGDDMPWITFASLERGFRQLKESDQDKILQGLKSGGKLEVCIFGEGVLPLYQTGLTAEGKPPECGPEVLSGLKAGCLATISGLESEAAQKFNGTTCVLLAKAAQPNKWLVLMENGSKGQLPRVSLSPAKGGSLDVGARVTVSGLKAEGALKYNGTQAKLLAFDAKQAKWMLELELDGNKAKIPAIDLRVKTSEEEATPGEEDIILRPDSAFELAPEEEKKEDKPAEPAEKKDGEEAKPSAEPEEEEYPEDLF